jgi:hypothetical protein
VDSTILKERAAEWGAGNVLYYLLHNSRAVTNTPVDSTLLETLQPNKFSGRMIKKILRPPKPQDHSKTLRYRLRQLAAQMVFPDRLSSALRFQANYAATRIKDLFAR